MPKKPLNPGDVDKQYRELLKCPLIAVAKLDKIPAGEESVYCFYLTGPPGDADPLDYQVTADEIESRAQLDVIWGLPDGVEGGSESAEERWE